MKCQFFAVVSSALAAIAALGPANAQESKSADELARELANPNNSLASLTFRNQFYFYDGSLPGAIGQSNYNLVFQPVFPFSMGKTESGGAASLFIRPAIPLLVDQPVFNGAGFNGVTGLGDIGFDIGYGVTEKNGLIWGLGMVGTLPTATDGRLASGRLSLGPEMLLAKFEPWGVYGALATHQWDVAGWSNNKVNRSTIQPILNFLPGGGWSIGTSGTWTYDWERSDWTIPLNLTVSKTLKFGSLPVKVAVEVNYYVVRPDRFGPEWMIGFNITPVVPNFIEALFRR